MTTRRTFTQADLEQLLVPIDDMPSGYSMDASDDDDDDPTRLCGRPAISESIPHEAQAEVTYLGGQAGPGLFEQLTSYSSEGGATTALDAARDALGSCTEFEDTDDDGTVTRYTIAALSFDNIADDQIASALGSRVRPVLGHVRHRRHAHAGNVIMLTGGLSVISAAGAGQLQPGDFVEFTKTAFSRIEDAS